VTFFGGEPLMNFPLIENILDYCTDICRKEDKKIHFTMTTNGTILNDRILERIKRHKIGILVSLDGPEEIHDRYRKFRNGKGTFKVIAENVKLMSQFIPVSARVTLTKNSPSLTEIGQALEEIGVKEMRFCAVSEDPTCSSCKNQNFDDMGMTVGQLLNLEAEVDRIGETLLENSIDKEPESIYIRILQDKRTIVKKHRFCECGGHSLAVSTNGDFFPCHRFVGMQAFKLGSVWDGINEKSAANFFNYYDKTRDKCRKCWAVNLCGGGCINETVADGCRFKEPNENKCIQIRAQKEGAIYLHMKKQDKKIVSSLT
jgi:radical SAM additional 4Fe4S-binding domain